MKLLVIGGVAAGASAAARARRLDERAEIVVLERGRAILMLAIRTQAPAAPLSPPARQEPVRYEPRYEPQRYEPPARARNLFDDEDVGDGWNPNDPFLPRR